MNSLTSNKSLGAFAAVPQNGILPSDDVTLALTILEAGFSTTLVFAGMIGNFLSSIVFYKIGYQDTINISMTFICLADFVRCIFVIIYNLHYPLKLVSPVLATTWHGIGVVTFSLLSLVGSYVASVLAAYVTLERCLCVSIPFSVKYLLTPRVVWINNTLITLIVIASLLIIYTSYTFTWVFSPELNATIPRQGFTQFYFKHPEMNVYITVIGIAWLSLSFCLICICSGIIVYNLRNASEFKTKVSQNGGQTTRLSGRDRQIIKMLLVIIMIYIAVNLPRILIFIGRIVHPDFDLYGKEHNLFLVLLTLASSVDYVNPAVNVLVFYSMSSQFKNSFLTIFCSSSERTSRSHSSFYVS